MKTATHPPMLTANTPLFLNDPYQAWLIESGQIAVFAVRLQEGDPVGERRYLFTVSSGAAMFGAPADGIWGLLAVALAPAAVQPLPFTPADDTCSQAMLTPLVDGWIQHLGQVTGLPRPPQPGRVPETHYVALMAGQVCIPAPSQVLWVRLQQGQAAWMGAAQLPVESALGCFPVGPGMFLTAQDNIEFFVRATPKVKNKTILVKGLRQLHRYFFQLLEELEADRDRQTQHRLHQRLQLNQCLTQQVVQTLTTVLSPTPSDLASSQDPYLGAVGAVGHALGITIKPAPQGTGQKYYQDPLAAIARASQVRLRRVLLRGTWWQQDNGPLVANWCDSGQPVALLPQPGGYDLFDPKGGDRQPVDPTLAGRLAPQAAMIYRPLPPVIRPDTLLKFVFQGQRQDGLMILATGLVATLLGMLVPQATALLVDQVIPYGETSLLFQLGLGLLAVALGRTSFQLAQAIATLRIETRSEADLQVAVWDRLLKLRPTFFRQYAIGDLNSRVSSINGIRRRVSEVAIQGLFAGAFALLNLGLLIYYSPPLAGVAGLVALLVLGVTLGSGLVLIRKHEPLLAIQGQLYGLVVQLVNGVAKLRIAGAEERAFNQWGQRYSDQLRLTLSTQRLEDAVEVFNTALPTLTTLVLFWLASVWVGGRDDSVMALSTGQFIAFTVAYGTFIGGTTALSYSLLSLIDVVPLWRRSHPILQAQPEIDLTKSDPGPLSGNIRLDRVSFRYRDDGPLILDQLSLAAQPGEFIALVGPSGSGKSTVMRLLLGFEMPQSGSVYFDGQDLIGLDVVAIRRQLGVVLQTSRLSAGSIFDNIAGNGLISLEDAWLAAEQVGFAEDIRALPMGMHTVVSEGGGNLSGGQRQRLLIARALANQPQIMLMDEATSALDNRTQAIVTESLGRLKVTRIVIAHRLSTIRHADRIYVLQAGRVVQQGGFAELANQPGLFAQLTQRQQL